MSSIASISTTSTTGTTQQSSSQLSNTQNPSSSASSSSASLLAAPTASFPIYNLFIYERNGGCLYYQEWNRTRPCESAEEEKKLLFGLIYSLKMFCEKSSPTSARAQKDFYSYTTSAYKLHYFETASGLKFILFTDPQLPSLRERLREVHQLYVRFCARNPFYSPKEQIVSEPFTHAVSKFVFSLASSLTSGAPSSSSSSSSSSVSSISS